MEGQSLARGLIAMFNGQLLAQHTCHVRFAIHCRTGSGEVEGLANCPVRDVARARRVLAVDLFHGGDNYPRRVKIFLNAHVSSDMAQEQRHEGRLVDWVVCRHLWLLGAEPSLAAECQLTTAFEICRRGVRKDRV